VVKTNPPTHYIPLKANSKEPVLEGFYLFFRYL
jgi:hypothetical protein